MDKIYTRYLDWNKYPRKKDDKGNNLCRWCSSIITAPRRTAFCSPECRHDLTIRTNSGYARYYVWLRDRGVCSLCDAQNKYEGGLWEADHIIPVSEGGGGCGLDNLRTLCGDCHKQETKLLRSRLAAKLTIYF